METENSMVSLIEIEDGTGKYFKKKKKNEKINNIFHILKINEKSPHFNQQIQPNSLNNRIISTKANLSYQYSLNIVKIINNNDYFKELSINAFRIILVIASLLFLFFTNHLLFYILLVIVMIISIFSKNGIDNITKITNTFLEKYTVDNNNIFYNEDVNKLLLI